MAACWEWKPRFPVRLGRVTSTLDTWPSAGRPGDLSPQTTGHPSTRPGLERQSEESQWEAARLIAEELAEGKSQRQLANEIGYRSHVTVGYKAQTWRTFGHLGDQERPSFNEAFHSPEVRGGQPKPAPLPGPKGEPKGEPGPKRERDGDPMPAPIVMYLSFTHNPPDQRLPRGSLYLPRFYPVRALHFSEVTPFYPFGGFLLTSRDWAAEGMSHGNTSLRRLRRRTTAERAG
jgi:hypothetical protein